MNKRLLVLLILLILVAAVAGFYFYNDDIFSQGNESTIVSSSSTPPENSFEPTKILATYKSETSVGISETISSSTSEVGNFTVVVDCENKNPTSVQIIKNGITLQTLSMGSTLTGSTACAPAVSEDINFDGYPDLMVPSDYGSGGSSFAYWLYSSTTQKFYCSDPNNDCSLMNPKFDAATRTVVSTDYIGAGTTDVQTYHVVDGNLILFSDVKGN